MQAIRPDGTGNVTKTHVVWQKDKDCSYVPSPIAVGPYFLVVSDTGIATASKPPVAGSLWRERLGPHYSASLVTANGLVYFLSDKGVMTIVRPGPKLEIVARNDLGEETYASPALSAGTDLPARHRLTCTASAPAAHRNKPGMSSRLRWFPFEVEGPDQVVDDLLRHGDVAADGLGVQHRLRRVLQHLQLVERRQDGVADHHHPMIAQHGGRALQRQRPRQALDSR